MRRQSQLKVIAGSCFTSASAQNRRERLICRGHHFRTRTAVLSDPRKLAAALMLLSGVTHVAQLAVYPAHAHVVTAAVFGVLYFAIGLYLLQPKRAALWCGALFPLIGGSLGIYRFIALQPNPFTVFHVIIDLVVIAICVRLLLQKPAAVTAGQ
jgi:uncharacterized membrane protein HdeD (DUF308 family)